MPGFEVLVAAGLQGLAVAAAIAGVTWLVATAKRDAGIVDSVWAILIVAAAYAYASVLGAEGARTWLVLGLATAWGLRLAIYITWRNWGEPEDHRYQAIRKRNEPNFALKSAYLVFGLQAVLAWIVSSSLLAAIAGSRPLGWLDALGAGVMVFGLAFETVGDWQLARFKSDPQNRGRVLDHGLWRYTRHPNYFGEFCVWWGAYAIAASAGGWWAIISPVLMSVLLLKVSGVSLLEKDIGERRPAYQDYVARTNAFFPGVPRKEPTR